MKPDKIYIQPNAHDRWFEGNKPNDNFVEYVRKDALLEWLKECFRLQDGGSWYSNGAADAFSKVIDKLNSM